MSGECSKHGEVRNAKMYTILVRQFEGKILLKCIIKIGCKNVDWIELALDTVQ
jgi:hypothetical protein